MSLFSVRIQDLRFDAIIGSSQTVQDPHARQYLNDFLQRARIRQWIGEPHPGINGASRFYPTAASESVKKRKVVDLGKVGPSGMRQIFDDLEAVLAHKEVADSDKLLSSEPEIAQRQLPERITCPRGAGTRRA